MPLKNCLIVKYSAQCRNEGLWEVSLAEESITYPPNPLLGKGGMLPFRSYLFSAAPVTLHKHIHIVPTKGGVYLNKECHQLLAERDRELKSKLAKQHNRKCEGQEDRASSLSLHRQQSAAALLTPENWSSSSSDAMTFKPRWPLCTTQKSTGLFTFLTENYRPLSSYTYICLFLLVSFQAAHCPFSIRDKKIITCSFRFLHFHFQKNVRYRTFHDLHRDSS